VSPRSWRLASALAATLVVVAASFGWFFTRRQARAPVQRRVNALAIVPPGPALVVTIDVARLRGLSTGRALLGRSLAELGDTACESALAANIDELTLALPGDAAREGAAPDALALIGSGRFSGGDVASCAEARVRSAHGDPVRTPIGSFTSVRDRRKSGEVAARDGLLVVSDGLYLRELIEGADGPRPDGTPAEHERDELHAELRRVVGQGAPIIATLALPPGWLSRALADPSADLSPLATIRSAAVRANVASDIELTGLLACDGSDPCAHLERFLGSARSDLASSWPEAAPLLARLTFTRAAARIDFSAHLTPEDVSRLSSTAPPAASQPPALQSRPPPAHDAASDPRLAPSERYLPSGAPGLGLAPQSHGPKPEPSATHD
jgi:hypothetical protein